MGLQTYLDFYLKDSDNSFKLDILKCLLRKSWTLNCFGKIQYFLDEEFDWIHIDFNEQNEGLVLKQIAQSIMNDQKCGISILLKNDDLKTGGDLLFFYKDMISFHMAINKQNSISSSVYENLYYKKMISCFGDKVENVLLSEN